VFHDEYPMVRRVAGGGRTPRWRGPFADGASLAGIRPLSFNVRPQPRCINAQNTYGPEGFLMSWSRKNVSTGSPYEPIVGISRAVRIGNIISVAGTAPLGPDGKTVAVGDAASQARRCFEISRAALEQAGGSLKDVIRTRIFLTRIEDWREVAAVHGEIFHDIRPANTIMQVSRFIDPDWLLETEVDAVVTDQ
jgi:enamine deaminase RidA (YjgF/YER057c/UK114 family)